MLPIPLILLLLLLLLLSQPSTAFQLSFPTKHLYKLTLKHPFYYLNNHTIPFYNCYGPCISTSDSIRISPSVPSFKGSVWSKTTNPSHEFMIHTKVRVSNYGSGGMAVFYTTKVLVPLSVQVNPESDKYGAMLGWYGGSDVYDGVVLMVYTPTPGGNVRVQMHDRSSSGGGDRTADGLGCYSSATLLDIRMISRSGGKLEVYIGDEICFSTTTTQSIKSGESYYVGVGAESGNVNAGEYEVLSVEVYEITSGQSVHDGGIKMNEEQRREFEDVHERVEKVRHQQQQQQHSDNQEALDTLHSTQIKILENIEGIAKLISQSGGGGSGSGQSKGGSGIDSTLHTKIDSIQHSIDTIKGQMEKIKDMVKESESRIVASQQQSHSQQQSQKSEKSDDASLNYWMITTVIFLVSTVVLYVNRRGGDSGDNKKFI